jgi:hypothetical protein
MEEISIYRKKSHKKSRGKPRKKSREKSRKKSHKTSKKATSREKFSLKAKFSLVTLLGFVSKLFDFIQSFY